jgi:predicted TPR repeat methyltransferase
MSEYKHRDLEGDLKQIADDVEHLAEDVREELEHAAEDAVGAQFARGLDLVESVGSGVTFGQQLGEIWWEQVRLQMSDYQKVTEAVVSSRSPDAYFKALSDHYSQRIDHISKGVREWNEAVATEHQKLGEIHRSIWESFRKAV